MAGGVMRKKQHLRVTTVDEQSGCVTLKVEGRISSAASHALERACLGHLDEGKWVQLELSEVSFICRRGVALLKAMEARAVYVIYASPFINGFLADADRQ